MPALTDPKHEAFARFVVQGKSKRDAAIAAGYEVKWASARGSKLAKDGKVGKRIAELQNKIAEKAVVNACKLIDLDISARSKRVAALDDRWQRLQQILTERGEAADMKNVPGGKTGLLCLQFRTVGSGRTAKIVKEYAVDAALLKEMRAHEQQAAQELGQWDSGDEVVSDSVTGEASAAIVMVQGPDSEDNPMRPLNDKAKTTTVDGISVQ